MDELELKLNLGNLTEVERQMFTSLYEKANNPKNKVWHPMTEGKYWTVDEYGDSVCLCWDDDGCDNYKSKTGNCFKTEEDSGFHKEKVLIQTELERFALENNTEDIDWKNSWQAKYRIIYDFYNEKISIGWVDSFKDVGVIYFTSEEIAKQAIKEIGEDRIKKYLFGIH